MIQFFSFLLILTTSLTALADYNCKASGNEDLKNVKRNLSRSLQVRGLYNDIFQENKNFVIIPEKNCQSPQSTSPGIYDTLCDISTSKNYRVQIWIRSEEFKNQGRRSNALLVKGTIKKDYSSPAAALLLCEKN